MPPEEPALPSHRHRGLLSRLRGARPEFRVSVELTEGPDLLCSLHIANPGPEFRVRSARLLVPKQGMIYRRNAFLADARPQQGFSDLRLDAVVDAHSQLRIPFEVWAPSWDAKRPIKLSIYTNYRILPYRCTAIAERRTRRER